MTIPLGRLLPDGSSCQPGPLGLKRPRRHCCPRMVPIWRCSRWGLPCRPCCQGRGGLLLHRFTFSPANAKVVSFLWRFPSDCSARALPGTVASGSPDFPLGQVALPKRPSSPPREDRSRRGCDHGQCRSGRPDFSSPRNRSHPRAPLPKGGSVSGRLQA